MFKPTYFILATAAAASMLAVPLSSKDADQDIIVSPRSDQSFVEEVSSDLDTQLRRMRFDPRWEPAGIVKIRFRAGEDGTPVDITTYESSGSKRLDREVGKAVERLDSLTPLPSSAGDDPIIQANVIVAYSKGHMERLSRKLAESEAARLASADPAERAVLALSFAPRPSS
ncbi:energy transducer TonB [Qipengyuania gaetbuli]|uniref:energy transducer TonB n=1 Tax=Qipengyuania gaetbuli TaxID=266952 RepID=UPI001CD2E1A0|nr:energy transducer TonB [Qipengyuania gaetbuli]MCA0909946.1 energy transducer TonB [Qipengyuania gaetbuli]